MPGNPRRVVTGHDSAGVSVVIHDGPVASAIALPTGTVFYEAWATSATPAPINATEPGPVGGPLSVPPPPNGTAVRIAEMPPGVASPVHRTQTVDYGIVLDGEVVLVLDGGVETTLGPGDIVIQRGTAHQWVNRSQQAARMAFVLIDGAFTEGLLAVLGGDTASALLRDPVQPPP